uniref:Formylglycine-generating enzyme, required for sulfatase activity, contains SUMF1/FGE domain n=1 Tax=Candidatus Kentrum sp. LPFa TaxID=2126335 RepID=A0A450XT56_9GAMM|nr:MAG: Formylglycine-generating enzyme, required for sulfatase activity, contains SUMF1/FGE domain [Candidatus Kentron sp. LPFa]VFK32470.1 MAG: Formylglycine-generating enzyme, required for sulfatase activity, contains SUMF1/FGE domain [Candidatus Kentron sp. LPFa]
MSPATTEPLDIPFLQATSFDLLHELPHGEEGSDRASREDPPALEITTAQERRLGIYQQGGHLIFKAIENPDSDSPPQGGLLAMISSADGSIGIETIGADAGDGDHASVSERLADDTDNANHLDDTAHAFDTGNADGGSDAFWKTGAPSWASDWGADQYGYWANFTVEGDDKTVTQRLRWIEPGHFLMGSPKQEPERYDDEGPQCKVTLRTGFWLFDTACTQDLWQSVMGDNPSRFNRPDQPVEQVSWNDIREFLKKINARIPGLDLVLPSEAEWEYSCRAGTDTPFSFGENITPNEVNYNGEYPYVDGETGPYRKCTVPVASLPPNPWGLYEMHGNVWEWTRDPWRENYQGIADDAVGPEADTDDALGMGRVVRGGSWRNVARIARSAVRDRNKPGDYSSALGFRCVRFGSDEPAGVEPANLEKEEIPVQYSSPTDADADADAAIVDEAIDKAINETGIRIEETTPDGRCPLPPGKEFSLRAAQEHIAFQTETKPKWASAIGRDRFGLWAEFSLETGSGNETGYIDTFVTQRLRWIPPGRFLMGSPESEWETFPPYERKEYCHQEGPRHQVILTRGYWLFDTPCTQALWEAVMGNNPSRFQSPARPVESVSWSEASEFMERINERIPGLDLALPTEAQWEYACRAGSETATYAGPLDIPGVNNAPILDAIAWYGGNSGIGFELDNGYDSSDWREKQYDHGRAGTHPVAGKRANPWGLYDMLGNVWEWCRDGRRDYAPETIIDPMGPMAIGVTRMVRGGSWYYFARYARSASRFRYLPSVRLDRLGFRCARNYSAGP